MPTPPGVYVEEAVPREPAPLEGVPTATAALLGWTPTGPTDIAMPVRGVAEFEQLFGGPHPGSWLGHAVRHFFENGGREARVVRMAGPRGGAIEPGTPAFEKALLGAGGVALLDQTDGFNLLCVPGESTPTVLLYLQGFCAERQAFLIADCAHKATASTMAAGPDPLLTGPDAANGALWFPWLRARDPATGRLRDFPPAGFVAGIIARTDAEHGVWKAPAGPYAGVVGATRTTANVSDADQAVLNARAINCIRTFPGKGTILWGGRTLAGVAGRATEWKYVSVRRLALFLEASIDRGTRWAVFEPNGEPLWARLRAHVETFLLQLWRQGAFPGASPRQAFFVKCDAVTTTQADIEQGMLNLVVGFAPSRPAEFVVLRFAVRSAHDRP